MSPNAAGHFLHFKVEIFNANAAEQPNLGPAVAQGTAGVRAPWALLVTSWGGAEGKPSILLGWSKNHLSNLLREMLG